MHEAYLRLVGGDEEKQWNSRGHFFGAAAEAMRRILVEQARRKKSKKRGGGLNRVGLSNTDIIDVGRDLDLIVLDDLIGQLERQDPRTAAVVKLRFFGGLTIKETAAAIGISDATADNDWAYARSWLRVHFGSRSRN